MAGQEQIHRRTRGSRNRIIDEMGEAPEDSTASERVERATTGLDDLLDDIDEVLESNAADFVKGYVQKGGQ